MSVYVKHGARIVHFRLTRMRGLIAREGLDAGTSEEGRNSGI